MIKTNHIITTNKTYINYIKKYNSDRIDKFLKIYTFELFNENLVLESFDKLYKNTTYTIKTKFFDSNFTNYKSNSGYQIWFKTDSNNEYRIDLIPLKNYNINIDSDFVWSISFTLNKNDINNIEYEELTNLGEEKEVLLRIGDIISNIDIDKNFVIGSSILDKKNRIYKNIMIQVFPDYNIEMNHCEGFHDNKGLYIWK